MSFKKLIISGALSALIFIGSTSGAFAQSATYKVQAGDTFWIISQKYDVDLLDLMEANNATENTTIYVGQKIIIPQSEELIHTVQPGDTFWIISQKYDVDLLDLMEANNATENTTIYVGQKIIIPQSQPESQSQAQSGAYITYESYTVQKGDNFWSISLKFGITMDELMNANNTNENTILNIGDTLKIPVHNVPVKETPGEQYGEYLDWWTEAQYVIPCGSIFEVVDLYTGKSFTAKRTTGSNHADVEPLTADDTQKLKEIWGGSFSWSSRPVIIEFDGRKIAASASGMPHAGNDSEPGGIYTSWRSCGYSAGYNFDWVKGNDMDGVFDIHFLNSTRHKDGEIDEQHQENIKIAAGIK